MLWVNLRLPSSSYSFSYVCASVALVTIFIVLVCSCMLMLLRRHSLVDKAVMLMFILIFVLMLYLCLYLCYTCVYTYVYHSFIHPHRALGHIGPQCLLSIPLCFWLCSLLGSKISIPSPLFYWLEFFAMFLWVFLICVSILGSGGIPNYSSELFTVYYFFGVLFIGLSRQILLL